MTTKNNKLPADLVQQLDALEAESIGLEKEYDDFHHSYYRRGHEIEKKSMAMEDAISNRIGYITKCIGKQFKHGKKFEIHAKANYRSKEIFYYNVYWECECPYVCKVKSLTVCLDGKKCNLLKSFPTRWLYEDFEEELQKACAEIVAKEKNKAKNRKKVLADLKKKLTAKELAALDIQ